VREWPTITDPALLERLALEDDQFVAYAFELWAALPRRELQPAVFEWALGYPWERPASSYILRGEAVELLDDVAPAKRSSTVRAFTADRHPLLSFGGNAAPSWLARKFAHFPEEPDRTVLVLAGELHGFDVGPAASLAPTGYMPATLFASRGTAVRAAVVWATPAQVTQLTWSEIPYRLVRLDDARFVMDEADVEVDQIFAYVHRLGSFCIDGSPVALAAIPASRRTARALTQRELLDVAARIVMRADAKAEDLVHAIFDDMAGVTKRAAETVWRSSLQLQARWTPYPTGRGASPAQQPSQDRRQEVRMDSQAVGAVEFRAGQRQQWQKGAKGWRKWSDFIDAATAPVSKRMVELARVGPGSRVLDVAAGYGEPSLTAAAVAGSEGKVVATDISPEMLLYGRERAAAAGLENVAFVESEAASLDFPAESFDAALSRFGIIFEPEAEATAGRVRGFLVPGSRMAIASWGPPERVPFIGIPMGTAMRTLGVDPPPPGTPGPLSRPTPEALGGLLEGGGFSDVEVEETEVSFEWESAAEFVAMVKDTVPPLVAMIDKNAPDHPDAAWKAILEAVEERASDDGSVKFSNLVLLAVGRA
jgi:SAM-dependent methyltransferase